MQETRLRPRAHIHKKSVQFACFRFCQAQKTSARSTCEVFVPWAGRLGREGRSAQCNGMLLAALIATGENASSAGSSGPPAKGPSY